MPLDHYVTLGRSGLRVSPLCLGAMTFGEDLGWGSSVEESQQIIDRYVELGGNFIDTANFYTKSHSEKIIGDHLGRHAGAARPPRHRDQVQRQPLPGRSQRRRLRPQVDRRRLRELAAPPADRLHRPLLAAQLGRAHADRGDHGRARRSRARRQGPLPRRLRHAGLEDRRGQRDRALPRLVAVHRPADRVLAARAHRRAGARADGARARPRHHAVVAAQERRAQRQVHARERGPGQGATAASSGLVPQREDLRRGRRARGDRQGARHHGRARRARLGAGAAGRDLDDHRRAPARASSRTT